MNRYLIDSSVFVAILRGEKHAHKLFESLEGDLITSSICLAELYEGIFRSKKQAGNERSLLKLLGIFDEILPFASQEAKLFGALKVQIKHKPIPDMDLQIAATCIQNHLILVTSDIRHFDNIPNLSLHKTKDGL